MQISIEVLDDLNLERIILEKDKAASIKYHHDVNLTHFLENRAKQSAC